MRKIVVFNLISLDGFFAGKDGNIDWHKVDDEFNEFAVEHTSEFDGIIFGATTFKMFEDFWPKALVDPETSPEDRKIAQIIDDAWKIFFSKSINKTTWKNSQIFDKIDKEEVKKWKAYRGRDLAIFGSGTIVQQFSNLGLIDEYRLMVIPVILGEGKPMFENVKKQELKLIKTREFKNGNILLSYVPV